jgi:HSP20 family molecular chaperone IbpA
MATKSAVAKLHTEVTIGSLIDEVQSAVDSICRQAYEFAAQRGFAAGHDLDDWLKAENELFLVPASELTETATEYILDASVADFEPEQIAVSVEPQCVTVWGKASMSPTDLAEGQVEREVGGRELFCQYRLRHPVVIERVRAVYESEKLRVTLPKQSEPPEADTERPGAA